MEEAVVNAVKIGQNAHCAPPEFDAQISAAASLLRQSDAPSIFELQFDALNSPLIRLWHEYVHQNPRMVSDPSVAHHEIAEPISLGHNHGPTFAKSTGITEVPEDIASEEKVAKTMVPTETVPVKSTSGTCRIPQRVQPSENATAQSGPPSHTSKLTNMSRPTPKRYTYTAEQLFCLRHSRRLEFPLGDLIGVSKPNNDSLPVLPFTPSEALTADVLLAGDDARVKFSDLQLSPALLSALPSAGFETPSPIQVRTIPRARLGCDVIAHAKSGTGKTAAYAVATLDSQIAGSSFAPNSGRPHTLVLVPTRELAIQTARVFLAVAAHILPSVSVATLVGGISEHSDVTNLANCPPHVVVGTPGRICSLVDSENLKLHAISVIVLDEADRLLSRAFQNDVQFIIDSLPQAHQTLAFSATFPPWLRRMLMNIMRKPSYITDSDKPNLSGDSSTDVAATQQAILLGVRQCKVAVQIHDCNQGRNVPQRYLWKIDVLVQLLREETFCFCMVFSNNKKVLAKLQSRLQKENFACKKMSGDISQRERNSIMVAVNNGSMRVVVATDLLARGIDVKACDLVVHLDVPSEVETYLHRVGRAGRFGRQGRSFLLYDTDEERADVASLESAVGYTLQHRAVTISGKFESYSGKGNQRENQRKEDSDVNYSPRSAAGTKMCTGSSGGSFRSGVTVRDLTSNKGTNAWSLPLVSVSKEGINPKESDTPSERKPQPNQSSVRSLFGEPTRPDSTHLDSGTPAEGNHGKEYDDDDDDGAGVDTFGTPGKGDILQEQVQLEKANLDEFVMNRFFQGMKPTKETVGFKHKRDDNGSGESPQQQKKTKLGSTTLDRDDNATGYGRHANVECDKSIRKHWVHLMSDRSKGSDERWENFAQEAWQEGYDNAYKRAFRMAMELSQNLTD